MDMARVLMLYAHPDYKKSVANAALLQEFRKLQPEAEIVNLDELYPDYKIDAKKEQDRLNNAQMIVFQYPFWWYSAPSLLHAYLEQVFLYGYAYGSKGNALKGKELIVSMTIGGPEDEYQRMAGVHHTIEQFLPAMLATAHFTGMIYRGSIYSFDMALYEPGDKARMAAITERAVAQAKRLSDHINEFVKK